MHSFLAAPELAIGKFISAVPGQEREKTFVNTVKTLKLQIRLKNKRTKERERERNAHKTFGKHGHYGKICDITKHWLFLF